MRKLHVLLVIFLIVAIALPACAPATPDCASYDVFCVGLVTDSATVNDSSTNQAIWEGIQQAEEELGARIQYIEPTDAKDYASNISTFGDQGYDVIVTVGSALAEATAAAAASYPDTDFIGVEQLQSETVHGVASLSFPEDQAGFLVGALAAMMSKSNRIGAVCPTDGVPSIWRFGEGYKAGAAYADQFKGTVTEVIVLYHEHEEKAFTDPDWGKATAQSMIDEGADVIFGCGGSTGDAAINTAAQAGSYAIGVNIDQYLTLPDAAPRMLTSAMKFIAPEVFKLIKLSKEGSFPSGNYVGEAGYAPYHELEADVPVAVKAMMEQIHAGLLDGSIKTNVSSASPND